MKTLILLLVLSFSILGQTYRYVDPEATGANNGLSWQNAWNGFDDFNINDHSKVPPGTTILVQPVHTPRGIAAIMMLLLEYQIIII